MSDDIYEPGEVYNITITGARVISVAHNGWIRFAVPDGPVHEIAPYSDAFTVERADPEWWPPRPGDLLREGDGLLWFACANGSNVLYRTAWSERMEDEEAWEKRHLLTLVHREDEQDGGGWEDPGNGADFFACEHKTTDEPGHDPSVCRRLTDAETDALTHGSAEQDGQSRTPTAGTEVPNRPGRVVGDCGHPVWRAVWDGGERTCQPCQDAFAAEMSGGASEPSVYEDMGVRDAIRAEIARGQDGGDRG